MMVYDSIATVADGSGKNFHFMFLLHIPITGTDQVKKMEVRVNAPFSQASLVRPPLALQEEGRPIYLFHYLKSKWLSNSKD